LPGSVHCAASESACQNDLDVAQHPPTFVGSFRIQLHRSNHSFEYIAYPIDSALHATGKEIIERRARQNQSNGRINVDATGRTAPRAIELQYERHELLEG